MEENNIQLPENSPMVSSFWKLLAIFLLGVVVGFMFAPIKGGINPVIASNNHLEGNDTDVAGALGIEPKKKKTKEEK